MIDRLTAARRAPGYHKRTLALLVALVGTFAAMPLAAADEVLAPAQECLHEGDPVVAGRSIARVSLDGLRRTEDVVVRREFELAAGQAFSWRELAAASQRVRNTQLFSRVDACVRRDAAGVTVTVRVEERWTATPIFKLGGSDESQYLAIGLSDINAIGKRLELGGKYMNQDGYHSFATWFRAPHFRGSRFNLGSDLAWVSRPRREYDDQGQLTGAYVARRLELLAYGERELWRKAFAGVGATVNFDFYGLGGLSTRELAIDEEVGFMPPTDTQLVIPNVYLRGGQLDYDNELVSGAVAQLMWEHALPLGGPPLHFDRVRLDATAAWRGPWRMNLVSRLFVGLSNATASDYVFRLGGLNWIRGLADDQLDGKHAWTWNAELRVPSVVERSLFIQHAVFVDGGNAFDDQHELLERSYWATGVGVRVGSPRLYGITLRVDWVYVLAGGGGQGISFGTKQFF